MSRTLIISNILSWVVILFFIISGYSDSPVQHFEKITAERIDILSEDGTTVMAIANKNHIPGPSMNGKKYAAEVITGRKELNGIIFFNDEGDEVGSLLFNAIPMDSISYWSGGQLTIDQYKQNQVVAMQYLDNSRTRRAGLRVWDRPTDISMNHQLDLLEAYHQNSDNQAIRDSVIKEMNKARQRGEFGAERLFIGSQDEVAQLQLRDRSGNIRARFYVDSLNQARLDFMNEEGAIISSYPKK